jgi:hypothetical protein
MLALLKVKDGGMQKILPKQPVVAWELDCGSRPISSTEGQYSKEMQ